MTGPALYVGRLRHQRHHPTPHTFTYDTVMALVDIDRVAEMMAVSRLASYNRFNWVSFDDRDHLGDPSRPLRARVEDAASHAGLVVPDGPLYLLTHLRYFGYAFNPISFYYCDDGAGALRLLLAEVNSTFGEQRLYWMPAPAASAAARPGVVRHRTVKTMHVSPFNPMHLDYEFIVTPPGETLVAHMNTFDRHAPAAAPFFDATLTLQRRPWNARQLHLALARHPVMSAKVIAAIHWQALRLWWKGLRYIPHPLTPAQRRAQRQQQEANR